MILQLMRFDVTACCLSNTYVNIIVLSFYTMYFLQQEDVSHGTDEI